MNENVIPIEEMEMEESVFDRIEGLTAEVN